MLGSLSEADDAAQEAWLWARRRCGQGLALVLQDLFAVPFEEIGPMVGRSPAAAATRQPDNATPERYG